jgi:hypothetical protein
MPKPGKKKSAQFFHTPSVGNGWISRVSLKFPTYKIINDVVMGRLASACWYTNIDIKKRHQPFFPLEDTHYYYEGNEDKYPKYYKRSPMETFSPSEILFCNNIQDVHHAFTPVFRQKTKLPYIL